MRLLGAFARGHDNNFNLLRLVAASAVLVSHSVPLATGDAGQEPLRAWLGMSLGTLAVDVFFVISGFLITGSLIGRADLRQFIAARALRIYPGLWAALLVTLCTAALLLSDLGPARFLSHFDTWKHLARNALLLSDVSFRLPGVFDTNPWPQAVNGSLWTLPIELRMYAAIVLLWLALGLLPRARSRLLPWAVLLIALGATTTDLAVPPVGADTSIAGLTARFFYGASLRLFQDRIPASRSAFLALLATLAMSTADADMFGVAWRLAVGYLVIYAALVPGGPLRAFNRVGDYSYGVYIYAFPVQQVLAHYWQGIGPVEMTVFAFAATSLLAAISWHAVEEPAMRLRHRLPRRDAARSTPLAPKKSAANPDGPLASRQDRVVIGHPESHSS